jgi:calcineurin-like phosphoesterase
VKIIFIGDIVGKSGREAIAKNISIIKNKYNPDAIIVNAENAASGYGLSKKNSPRIIYFRSRCNYSWQPCVGSERDAFLY